MGDISRFDGRRVSKITNQKDAETLVQCLFVAFTNDDSGLEQYYQNWLKKQPLPRPKHAICCVLGLNDVVHSKRLPWIIVPQDGKCPFPIDWQLYENPDTQLMVFVQVAFGKTKSVKAHVFYTIG